MYAPENQNSNERESAAQMTEKHQLYTEADNDAPDSIKNAQGEIVLGLCKKCGKAERELETSCTPATQIDNSKERESAAQMWKPKEDGNGAKIESEDRYTAISQYVGNEHCRGKWHWQSWSQKNPKAEARGIVDTEEQARAAAEMHHAMSDEELIDIQAQKLLDELEALGWKPRTEPNYAKGYDDGYKAAIERMSTFLNFDYKG